MIQRRKIAALIILVSSCTATAGQNISLLPVILEDTPPKEFYMEWLKAGKSLGYPKVSSTTERTTVSNFDGSWFSEQALTWNNYPEHKRLYISGAYVRTKLSGPIPDDKFKMLTLGYYQCMNSMWFTLDNISKHFNTRITNSIEERFQSCTLGRLGP